MPKLSSDKLPKYRKHRATGQALVTVVLGHRSAAITEVYAEIDHAKAAEIMLKVG
jgi:hypothetical protein